MKIKADNYVLGIGIILIPFLNFLSLNNLTELNTFQITYSGLSLIPVVLIAFFLSWGISRVRTRRVEFRTSTLFPLICVGFYLQFYYLPLKEQFERLFALGPPGDELVIYKTLALLLLASVWVGIIVLGSKYPRFSKRVLMAFTSLFLVITIVPSLRYLMNRISAETVIHNEAMVSTDTAKLDLDTISSFDTNQSSIVTKPYPNVYFVIVDGMMSLEHASDLGIVDRQREQTRLNSLGLTYVEKSLSAYNQSTFTISSIFELDYPQTPTMRPYINEDQFFPSKLILESAEKQMFEETSIPLLYVLKKKKIRFIWEGNNGVRCFPSEHIKWRCGSVDTENSIRLISKLSQYMYHVVPFYGASIGGVFLHHLLFIWEVFRGGDHDDNPRVPVQHSLVQFMNSFDAITSRVNYDSQLSPHLGGGYFAFIHHFSPHAPFEVTETCDGISNHFANDFMGYRANYRCALQEIEQFLEKINTVDPNSIIVIQGDHGWGESGHTNYHSEIEFTEEQAESYNAEIFNAIKAPEACFERYGIPQSTVNSIRFVLNCAYQFKFQYVDDIHYLLKFPVSHPKFGTVLKYVGGG